MLKPAPKFKPKKISAEEPPSIPFNFFVNFDIAPCIYGAAFELADSKTQP